METKTKKPEVAHPASDGDANFLFFFLECIYSLEEFFFLLRYAELRVLWSKYIIYIVSAHLQELALPGGLLLHSRVDGRKAFFLIQKN